MKVKQSIKSIITVLSFIFFSNANAQFDDPDADEDGENAPLNPTSVPIDDYVPILTFGAAALGLYFLRKKKVERST
jgi:hypothetical protein